jgi:hypothetical protein
MVMSHLVLEPAFTSFHLFSQNYFQKIYKFEDSTAIIGDIVIHNDTNAVFIGNIIYNYLHYSKAFISEIDKTGELVNYSLSNIEPFSQLVGFNKTNSQTDFNGNYLLAYLNSFDYFGSTGIPRITVIDENYNFIFDTIYNTFSEDSLIYFNAVNLVKNERDSTFYMCVTFIDLLTDSNPDIGFDGQGGTIIFKIDKNFEICWVKKLIRPLYMGYYPPNIPVHLRLTSDNQIKLITSSYFSYGGTAQDWGKIHYYTLDTAGNILSQNTFQDTQYDLSGNGYLPLENGDILATYFESQLFGSGNSAYFKHRSIITRLDSNLNQLWKDTLRSAFGNHAPYSSPSKILQVNDSSMVYAYQILKGFNVAAMRLESRNLNGNVNWQREYQYYDNNSEYQILDVEKFSNGDLIFAGQVINNDLINQNKSGQNGYVLKTNCLGFMGDPQANFSYTVLDSNMVQFVNLSAQAGSYLWDFGDGSSLQTGEKVDTVFHTFAKDSIFTVQLIAHGCNAIADTFSVNLDFQKPDSIPPSFESLLTVYPNPLGSEELLSVYVGAISSKKHSLVLLDALGKKVATYLVPKANINLSFDVPAANGLYFLNLVEEDKVLVSRKVVVE